MAGEVTKSREVEVRSEGQKGPEEGHHEGFGFILIIMERY